MAYAFDAFRFTQRLEQVCVGREQAAYAELAREMILGEAASKDDIGSVRRDGSDVRHDVVGKAAGLRRGIGNLDVEIAGSLREPAFRSTIKLGAIVAATVATVPVIQKLF